LIVDSVDRGLMSELFLDFFFRLRRGGLPISSHEWLAFVDSLKRGLHRNSLDGFYEVARCVLVTSEVHYDAFDQAFAEVFRGVAIDRDKLLKNLDAWLSDPRQLEMLEPAALAQLQSLDIHELREQLLKRLEEQNERHSGGSKWIGTGGTSAFGQSGIHPTGVRIGGQAGRRSALAVADKCRFRGFRQDLVLDTRQIAAALRRLRKLSRRGGRGELDLDATVVETARNCGDLEVVMRPPRKNDVRMLLLLDVGGSMDAHARLVSRLFSAANRGGGFRELRHYYFHNCVYSKLYEDAEFTRPVELEDVLRLSGSSWYLVMVGDAWMHPGELSMSGSAFWEASTAPSGLRCLSQLADTFKRSAWLNPESRNIWDAPSVEQIRDVFSMFELTLEGIDAMVAYLRRASHRAP